MPAIARPTRRHAARGAGPRGRRWLATGLAAAALVLLPAVAASAHIRVIPDQTTADGFAKMTFRVPNESATAGTVKVAITLPTDAPFTSVTTQPIPGWTAQVVTSPLPKPVDVDGATLTQAPSSIVWTADAGTQIAPGQFQEFSAVAGPLPAAGSEVTLPATQTYSDGTVVVWDQVAKDGAAEPELPAPVLVVPVAEDAASPTASPEPTSTATAQAAGPVAAGADPLARWLSGAGLVLGAGALVVAARRTKGQA